MAQTPTLRIAANIAKWLKKVIRSAWRDTLATLRAAGRRLGVGLKRVDVRVVGGAGGAGGVGGDVTYWQDYKIVWALARDDEAWAMRTGARGWVALRGGGGGRARRTRRVYGVMVHEFAHLFGVGHVRQRKGDRRGHVMSVTGVGRFCRRQGAGSRGQWGRLRRRWLKQLQECV